MAKGLGSVLCGLCLVLALGACGDDNGGPPVTDGGPGGDGPATDGYLPGDGGQVKLDGPPTPDPRPWKVSVVDDTANFKARVAPALGADGQPQLAYNIATSADGWTTPDVWHAHQQGGAWTKKLVAQAQGLSNEFPNLEVDGNGTVHVCYNRLVQAESQVDLFCSSGSAGQLGAPVNVTKSKDTTDFAVDLAADAQGTLHLLFQREQLQPEENSVGYLNITGGQPSQVVVVATGTADFALNPGHALAVDGQGNVHAVYTRPGSATFDDTLYYRKKAPTGGWGAEIQITENTKGAWGPSIGVDSGGTVHLVYVVGADLSVKTLSYRRIVGGTPGAEQKLSTSAEDRSYYLGLAVEPDGTVNIAFSRFYQVGSSGNNADILYLRGKNGTFLAEERVTNTPDLDETAPGIVVGPNRQVWLSFVENLSAAPDGKIYLATKE